MLEGKVRLWQPRLISETDGLHPGFDINGRLVSGEIEPEPNMFLYAKNPYGDPIAVTFNSDGLLSISGHYFGPDGVVVEGNTDRRKGWLVVGSVEGYQSFHDIFDQAGIDIHEDDFHVSPRSSADQINHNPYFRVVGDDPTVITPYILAFTHTNFKIKQLP